MLISYHIYFPDCCFQEYFGKDSFKGRYRFNTTVIGDQQNIPCKYNPEKYVHRECLRNKDGGGVWSVPNMDECVPKYDSTKALLDLDKVCAYRVNLGSNICQVLHAFPSYEICH